MRRALLPIALLMTAACSKGAIDDLPRYALPLPVASDVRGADAHVAPSVPDAVLRYGDHARAFAELRLPEGKGPFPLAVIFHGGCWKAGLATQAYMAPLATRWQQLGIASLNVDYREVGDGGGWPGSFADWQAAAELVGKVVRDSRIDAQRVTLVGHSAGGLPAQWLAMAQDAQGPVGAREAMPARAAIVFDGQADVAGDQAAFDGLCRFPAVEPFMGGTLTELPDRYAAVSPMSHPPKLAELLFVQAILPPTGSRAQDAIRSAGTALEIRSNPGSTHFQVITPGDPVYQANEAAVLKVLRAH